MARPREFDRDAALEKAMAVFWAKGFAATSTEDLLAATGIGRQSLYNAFGDKRGLYLEALARYQHASTSAHIARLTAPASALDGIRDLLVGLVVEDEALLRLGCMGVCAIGEFGIADPELVALRARQGPLLQKHILARVREGQAKGEIDPHVKPAAAASFVQTSMLGMQVEARAGAEPGHLRDVAAFAVERLRTR